MDEIVSRIIAKISEKSGQIVIDSERYKIDENNFQEIADTFSKNRIAFVDGGNLEILKTPFLSVFFNRTFSSTYQDNRRISSERKEFYTLISTAEHDGKIMYEASCYGLDLNYSFDPKDSTLTSSSSKADISTIGNIMRRFAELKAAAKADSDIIVLDGSLECKHTHERGLMEGIIGKKLFGLSKSNDLLTDSGISAGAFLLNAKKKSWAYRINETNFMLKLHDKSDYVFRLESSTARKEDTDEAISLLKNNSKDIMFPGYPYGLLEADRLAKVTEKERKMLELQLKMKLGRKITPFLNCSNAHDLF
jgi:uncharacterized membrane protein YkoI